jgi:DNA primase
MNNRQALDTVLNQIREPVYFAQYLTSFGYDVNKKFHCPNPDHPDKHPSAGVIRQSNRGWCFSCQTSFDIFDLCVWLEGKPASGPGWVTETVKYLADRYAIPFDAPDLTAEELREVEVISAYSHAYQIIRHVADKDLRPLVKARVDELQYAQGLRYKLGIGAVASYEDYLHRMTSQYKHSLQLLQDCDLADGKDATGSVHFNASRIFAADTLIYTIRDVDGMPVGFSARDLLYEQRQAEYDAGTLKYMPKKYSHTRDQEKGTLFAKKTLLYNLDFAKKFDGPITVVEGNPDCVTLYGGGELGTVATLGTAFTREHLDILISLGKKHIIVAMDGDKAGATGTKKVIDLVKEVGGNVGLRLEVVLVPQGVKDPDEYVRKFATLEQGVDAWRKLPRLDMFTWSLKTRVEAGEDPLTICESTLPLIVNEPSFLLRSQQAKQLAHWTNTNEDFVQREVLRLIDKDDARLNEERALINEGLQKKLRQDPEHMSTHLAAAIIQLETLNKKKIGYNPESVLKTLDQLFDQKERNDTRLELITGYPLLDAVFGGLPRYGSLICLPGKPSHGKSIFLDNVIIGLLDNNPELMILLHTVDDATNDRLNRLLGAKTGMPSDCFRRPGYYLNDPQGRELAPDNFHERYFAAKAWLRNMHEEERLIVVDPSILPSDLACLNSWVQDIRKKFPERVLVVVGDNFHLYSMVTEETGEGAIRAMSRYINDEIVAAQRTTVLFTMEIPKEQLRPGVRPAYTNLKGSGGLSFDAKANCGVYNQLQDYTDARENVSVWWESSDWMETIVHDDGMQTRECIKKPVIEIIVDKNKISGEVATIFYHLENRSGQMTECCDRKQQEYRTKLAAAAEARNQAERTRGAGRDSRAQHRARL